MGSGEIATSSGGTRAVFLDRDGVINEAIVRDGRPYPPRTLSEVRISFDAPAALSALRNAGFLLVVVTNQPDVARGRMSPRALEEINTHLLRSVPIDDIRTCIHDASDACVCRKPSAGAILAAASEYGISLPDSYLIGDRWSDMEAGSRAACTVVHIDRGYVERQPLHADYRATSLMDAVRIILQREKARRS